MYKIGTFNKISPVGLSRLTDDFALVEDQNEANGIILRSYDMHEMDFSGNLLAIGRAGAGTNNIPVDKCAEQGSVVVNAPGANANAVKELCLAGMLLAARNIPEGLAWAKTLVGSEGVGKLIEKGKGQFAGTEIKGKTLGVIGLGAIGVLVANAAEQLGMKVIGYDAFYGTKAAHALSPSVKVVDQLKDLYPECDYVSIHVPANDSTKGMVNAEAFAQMKDGVVFLNFARDKLMNDADLLAAIDSGKVAKYVTDFANPTVAGKKNVIVTPHLGASTEESEDNCAVMAVKEIKDFFENGNVKNSVNYPACDAGICQDAGRLTVCHKNIPNMLTQFTGMFAAKGVNVSEMVSKSRGDYAYTILDISVPASQEVADAIATIDGVVRVRVIK